MVRDSNFLRKEAFGSRLSVIAMIAVPCLGLLSSAAAGGEAGLVACWQFEESEGEVVKDTSGCGNQGRICGGAGRIKDIFGSCLSFDGVDDYVEVADSENLNFGDSTDFTLELWVKTYHKNRWQMLIDKRYQRAPYEGYSLLIRKANQLQFIIRDKAGNDVSCLRDFSNYLNWYWHYIVGVADRDDKASVYVDGELFAERDMSKVGNIDNPLNLLIANAYEVDGRPKSPAGSPEFIDKVCIYNRALSAEEIKKRHKEFLAGNPELGKVIAKDIEHVQIYPPAPGKYVMYGGLTKLKNGDILYTPKTGSNDPKSRNPWTIRDETIIWTRSSDGGRTWTKGFNHRDTPEDTHNIIFRDSTVRFEDGCKGNGYQAKDGTIYHPFYMLNEDYEESDKAVNWMKPLMGESYDDGKSWRIKQIPLRYYQGAAFGGITKLSNGTLLLTVYGAKERASWEHEAGILRSTDDGKTWSDYSDIGGPGSKLNETDIVELPNGDLVSVSRTQFGGLPLYQGLSTDKGYTWTVKRLGDLKGCAPTLLYTKAGPATGTLILSYINKDRHRQRPAPELGLCFSHDGGKTWKGHRRGFIGCYRCLLEIEPGKILFAARGRGTIFTVPFPVGIKAQPEVSEPNKPAIKVSWAEYKGDDVTGYQIHRSNRGSFVPSTKTLVGKVAKDVFSYMDDTIEANKRYYYRVIGMSREGKIGHSWEASAKIEEK